jgi:F-type H+-transporting ATPase subunit delta
MAEIATIARPYAEALFKSVASVDEAQAMAGPLQALAAVAAHPDTRRFAEDPKVDDAQVYDVIASVAGIALSDKLANLLRLLIANGRLAALPEIVEQFQALVKAQTGTSDALIQSAFPMENGQLEPVVATLEKRFGRRLSPTVEVDPSLIGGIRVVVGDEVLDTSVRARLEKMRAALTA